MGHRKGILSDEDMFRLPGELSDEDIQWECGAKEQPAQRQPVQWHTRKGLLDDEEFLGFEHNEQSNDKAKRPWPSA